MLHPSQTFVAPARIESGVPLKDILGKQAIEGIATALHQVMPSFAHRDFCRQAQHDIEPMGLMDRGDHIARVLHTVMAQPPGTVVQRLVESFGPPLRETSANGLAPFWYLPHSSWLAMYGPDLGNQGLDAVKELTKRFTGEFAIRPFLNQNLEKTLAYITPWCEDPDPHVRRLVSEGTRPRLPWACRIGALVSDPTPVLSILERLVDDPETYVYRSVANHLGDIAKDHPAMAFTIARRWLDEGLAQHERKKITDAGLLRRLWIIRHAVRLPAKKGVAKALALRRDAGIKLPKKR